MQSYKLHSVSEHLKDRHPYTDPNFNERYNPSEVYHAVFDRSVPKLIEILLMVGIDVGKHRDALITLNSMVSHQELKDEMISQGLVSVVSQYLDHSVVEIRREAVLMLGSLVSLKRGRDQMMVSTYEGVGRMLFDSNILARAVSGRDGVDILCRSKLVKVLIQSFLKFSDPLELTNIKFIIYLLEAFTKVLEYDNGIVFFIRSGVVKRMNDILRTRRADELSSELAQRINYLTLECLAKVCCNHEGKAEGIEEKVILSAANFLDSQIQEESWYSAILIMNCTILLEGKQQSVHVEYDSVIKKLLGLLENKNTDFRRDVKQALVNIAEYPEGFLIITRMLANNIPYLDDLFGPRVVIALSTLLPKTSSLAQPPQIPSENIENYKSYVKALCFFIRNYDEAHTIAVQDTVKIEEKLIPFLPYRQLSDLVAHSLYSLCNFDSNCKEGLYNYLVLYGDVYIDISKSTLKEEIKSYKKFHDCLIKN